MLIPVFRPPGLIGGGGGPAYKKTPLVAAQDIPAGFPVPIHSDMFDNATHNQAIFSNMQSDGGDLRAFSDSSLTTQLPLELMDVDTGNNKLLGYFRTTSAITSGNTIAWLRTLPGGSESQPAVGSTYGRNNVWQDYEFVSHDGAVDATGGVTPTVTGTVLQSGANLHKDWPARGYWTTYGVDGNDRVDTNFSSDLSSRTISCFVLRSGAGSGGGNGRLWSEGGSDSSRLRNNSGAYFNDNWSTTNGEWSAAWFTDEVWTHFAMTYDDSSDTNDPSIYYDGTSQTVTEQVAPAGSPNTGLGDYCIGNRLSAFRAWGGMIGGFRIFNGARSASWLGKEADGYQTPTNIATAGELVSA